MRPLKSFIIALLFCADVNGKAQIQIGATGRYTGKVVDDQGLPVPGAAVDCYHYQDSPVMMGSKLREPELKQQTVTDAEGMFVVAASPSTTLVVVKKAGLAPGWKTWLSDEDDSTEPVILTPPTTLSGVVLDENDHPVADAEVSVSEAAYMATGNRSSQRNDLFGPLAHERFSTRTTADGGFRIENFPADAQAALTAAKPGMAQHATAGHYLGSREFQSGQQGITLLLAPAGAIEGKVLVQETDQPVANVQVWLLPSTGAGATHGPVSSSADGSFQIPDLQPASYNVWAVMPGQPVPDLAVVPDYRLAAVTAGQTTRNVLIHATAGILVEVSVVLTNDLKPLDSVTVSSGRLTAYTDANGKAVLRMTPGKARFSASKPDWSPRQTTAEIESGQTNHVLIQMIPPPHIAGMVRDPAGLPASGVRVSFHPGRAPMAPLYGETRTDKNGRYEMAIRQDARGMVGWNGPIDRTNFVMAQDFERNLAAIREFDAILTNLDLNLQPGITISGSVIDSDGAPVTSTAIDLKMLSGHSFASVENKPIKVDARGSFSFPALPQGRQYSVFDLTAKGYGSAFGRVKPEESRTNQYEFPTFVLKKADRILAGQVLGVDGKPVSEVPVRFYGQGQRQNLGHQVKSDNNGRFVFDKVCEGPVTVSAEHEHQSANAPAQGGDTNAILRLGIALVQARPFLTPPLRMTGTVRDARGKPAAGVKMSFYTIQSGHVTTQTDADGHYELTWQKRLNQVEPDWVLARDFSRNLAAVHQVDETTTNLDLIMEDGITLSTRVSDPDGSAVANATAKVTLWHEKRGVTIETNSATTDKRGNLRIAALPQKQKYWVEIGAAGYASTTLHVEAKETKTNHLELPPCILMQTDRGVAGQVVDAEGNPAAGIELQINAPGTTTQRGRTDSEGHFVFHGISRGTVSISAGVAANGVPARDSSRARAKGGDTNVLIRLGPSTGPLASNKQVTTSGTVFGPSGAPVSGALVVVLPGGWRPARSETNGKYTLHWQTLFVRTNKAALFVQDPEHNWAATVAMDASTANLDIHLQPGLTLSGTVQNSRGEPVTNASVQLIPFPPDDLTRSTLNRQPPTDANIDGLFSFKGLPRGVPYLVRVSADGYGAQNIRVAAADTNSKQLELPKAVLDLADQQVAGKVVDLDGKPCWGAEVTLAEEDQPPKHLSHTDSNGYFVIKGVCKGSLTVRARPPASGTNPQYLAATEQAQGGETNVVLNLRVR